MEKINGIRASIGTPAAKSSVMDTIGFCFSQFETVSLLEIHDIIFHLKHSLCPSDTVPVYILKDGVDIISLSILSTINSSLYNGVVPPCLKQAIIEPILKKDNLDVYDLKNYCPISKHPILFKILENY